MEQLQLAGLLERIPQVRVGIIGDFCLDAYWTLDPDCRERSIETGKPVNRVIDHRYGLGGAGNVVANLAALGVGGIRAFGVVGRDAFGLDMLGQLDALRVARAGMIVQENWLTSVYAKPYEGEEEQSRFDFGTANKIEVGTERELIAQLTEALPYLDALIVNQQLSSGYLSAGMIDAINRLAGEFADLPILVDSRGKSKDFNGVLLKVNAHEAAAMCENEVKGFKEVVPLKDVDLYARQLFERTGLPVVVTRGEHGMAVFEAKSFTEIPGIHISGPTDPVGAGDTACAMIAALLGTGSSLTDAARVANIATSVTVRKLRQTGTATREEVLAAWAELTE